MGHTPSNLNFNTYLPSTTEADSNSPHSDLIGIKPIRNKECLLTPDNSHTCVCLCCLTRVCSGRLWEYDFNNSNNLILLLSSSSRPTPKDLCRCLFMDQTVPILDPVFPGEIFNLIIKELYAANSIHHYRPDIEKCSLVCRHFVPICQSYPTLGNTTTP
ncbi:hypothetical protein BJ165DRAFT_675144 [Panaeolus papilionaceus]|nr:hypothetical protein BJ165DRAFT_675144 [Panaeolus papilionaceus]